MRLFAPRNLLAFDNVRKSLDIIVLVPSAEGTDGYDRAQGEIDAILESLRRPLTRTIVFPRRRRPRSSSR